jgi:hypothetical protein
MNNLQSSDTQRRMEALEKEIELLNQTSKHRGRVLTALALIVAALAVPIVILVPLLSTDWSYAVKDDGKVSFQIASRGVMLRERCSKSSAAILEGVTMADSCVCSSRNTHLKREI